MTNAADPPHSRRPTPGPPLPRRVRLTRAQWIGIPLMLAIPLTALTGALGDWKATAHADGAAIRLEVEHPTVQRVGQRRDLTIVVENVSTTTVDSVLVEIDPEYLAGFGEIHLLPPPDHAFRLLIPRLRPGERSPVRAELVAARPWTSRGEVTVSAAGAGEPVVVPIRTFVLP
jgi:hypothetical protein